MLHPATEVSLAHPLILYFILCCFTNARKLFSVSEKGLTSVDRNGARSGVSKGLK